MCCLFCNGKEKNYKPSQCVEFVCSRCVLLLANADQDDLKLAYQKAVSKKFMRKAEALKMFIISEEKDGKRPKTKKHRRHFNRSRINRTIENQKERIKRVAL